MDKTLNYKGLVKNILNRYVEIDRQQPQEGIEYFLITDNVQGHYLWTSLGWSNGKRTRYVHAYLRVKEGKIYIEEDWTEQGIATDLLNEGVPSTDIVLAFHEPSMRQYTEFAVV
jgi:XisI protein